MGLLELVVGFCGALWRIPWFRTFMVQVFIELITRDDADPAFRRNFLTLTSQLGAATTEEEKRAILLKIKALKRGVTPAP